MAIPVIAPGSVRSDLRFLFVDLRRPSSLMWVRGSEVPEGDAPDVLVTRVESGLHEAASLYRRMVVIGVLMMLMPIVLAALFWWALWGTGGQVQPFIEGVYAPVVPQALSLYEAVGYLSLAGLALAFVTVLLYSVPHLPVLSGALKRLMDADESQRAEVLDIVASGRWPRVDALLVRGRGFESYREARVPGSAGEVDAG